MSTPETAITGDTLLSKPKRHGGSAVPECEVVREWRLLQERMTKFALLEKIDALLGYSTQQKRNSVGLNSELMPARPVRPLIILQF
jgi:hypothetical protein